MRLAWKKVRDRYHAADPNVPEFFKVQFRNLLALMDFFIPIVRDTYFLSLFNVSRPKTMALVYVLVRLTSATTYYNLFTYVMPS